MNGEEFLPLVTSKLQLGISYIVNYASLFLLSKSNKGHKKYPIQRHFHCF